MWVSWSELEMKVSGWIDREDQMVACISYGMAWSIMPLAYPVVSWLEIVYTQADLHRPKCGTSASSFGRTVCLLCPTYRYRPRTKGTQKAKEARLVA
jgi:hypothetical protein